MEHVSVFLTAVCKEYGINMKRRGQSAYAIIKAEFSLKGSKQKVYDQLTELLNKEEK